MIIHSIFRAGFLFVCFTFALSEASWKCFSYATFTHSHRCAWWWDRSSPRLCKPPRVCVCEREIKPSSLRLVEPNTITLHSTFHIFSYCRILWALSCRKRKDNSLNPRLLTRQHLKRWRPLTPNSTGEETAGNYRLSSCKKIRLPPFSFVAISWDYFRTQHSSREVMCGWCYLLSLAQPWFERHIALQPSGWDGSPLIDFG